MEIISNIKKTKEEGGKQIALLIDPDSLKSHDQVLDIANKVNKSKIDFLLFGGSLITAPEDIDPLAILKKSVEIPVLLFPSSPAQIRREADGILFLSLLSGRNPEYLIGHHVVAAPLLKNSGLEVLPTGYLLVGCGKPTTAEYISGTPPIPYEKPEIAATTALAGEYLGLKLIYLDGGSGAERPISEEMIKAVSENITVPLIVGGGIRKTSDLINAFSSGADLVVVGTAFEENPDFVEELDYAKKWAG